jgi:hypothetical protein
MYLTQWGLPYKDRNLPNKMLNFQSFKRILAIEIDSSEIVGNSDYSCDSFYLYSAVPGCHDLLHSAHCC